MVQWIHSHARFPELPSDIVDLDYNDDTNIIDNQEFKQMHSMKTSKQKYLSQKRLRQLTNEGVRMIPYSIQPVPVQPAPLFQFISDVIGFSQMCIIAICILGPTRIYEYFSSYILGQRSVIPPPFVQQITEARWQLIGVTFFVGNIIKGFLTSSSAFEIFLGDQLIFSGLDAQRNPNVSDLVSGLERAGAFIINV